MDLEIAPGSPYHLTSTKPVMIAQLPRGWSSDQVTGDPSMTILQPTKAYVASASFGPTPRPEDFMMGEILTLQTPGVGYVHYGGIEHTFVNLVAETSNVGGVRLNGVPVPGTWKAAGW